MNIVKEKRNTLFGLDYFDVYGVYAPGRGGTTFEGVTFYLPLTASSTTNLPQTITISGSTHTASVILYGKDATADTWVADNDATFALYSNATGDLISASQDTPLTNNDDKSVQFNGGKTFFPDTGVTPHHLAIGAGKESGSMYMEFLIKNRQTTNQNSRFLYARSGPGWDFRQYDGTYWGMLLSDGANYVLLNSGDGMPAPVPNAWEFFQVVYCGQNQTARIYRNGLPVATKQNTSIKGDLLPGSAVGTFGSSAGGSEKWSGSLGYFGFWTPELTDHQIDTFAAERFQKLTGMYPEVALGDTKYYGWTSTPATRNSTAVLDKYNAAGEKKHFLVGNYWNRICQRKDRDGELFSGFLSEVNKTTLVSNINAPLTGASTVAITGSQTGTFDGATAFRIDEAVGGTGTHYIQYTTNSVVSDKEYVASVYVKPNGRNVIRIRSTSVNSLPLEATFNLIGTGSVATQPRGSGSSIEMCGDGWYRCQAWTKSQVGGGNTNLYVHLGLDDLDLTYPGVAGKGVIVWCLQLELGNEASSPILSAGSYATRQYDLVWYKANDGNYRWDKHSISFKALRGSLDNPISARYITISKGGGAPYAHVYANARTDDVGGYHYASSTVGAWCLNTLSASTTASIVWTSQEGVKSAVLNHGIASIRDTTNVTLVDASANRINIGRSTTITGHLEGLINNIKIRNIYDEELP